MKLPTMIKTISKEIDAIGYDKNNKRLFVEMKNKDVVYFSHVDEKTYSDFLESESKIRFLTKNVIPSFRYEKIWRVDR